MAEQATRKIRIGAAFGAGPLVIGLLVLGGGGHAAEAGSPTTVTLYVDGTSGTSGGCGAPDAGACPTIQDAINVAQQAYAGDAVTIEVATGLYSEQDTIDASNLASLAIDGASPITTAINGNGNSTDVTVNGGTVTLAGLSIQNGAASQGGAVNNSANLTLSNDVLQNDGNHGIVVAGGALYNSGTATLDDDTFSSDLAVNHGSAVYSTRTLNATGTTFSGNDDYGDGVAVWNSGTATITGSTFSNNTTGYYGGGVFNQGTATLTGTRSRRTAQRHQEARSTTPPARSP